MRKWNKKSKHAFLLFAFLVFIILILIVSNMIRLMNREEERYNVAQGSYFYNNENQLIHLNNSSGEITKHWTGTYYLIDNEENKYNLGNTSVVYDPTDYKIYVFGNNYQVYQDTTIEKHTKMTEIVRNVGASFYKLEDRKYLVVAPTIIDENQTESFDSFLLVELDKNGNATLLNHEIQKRTLHAMTIVTNEYKFDIANEKLYWGESEIDLKKVGGSSNEYKEVVKEEIKEPTVTPTPVPTPTPSIPQIDISDFPDNNSSGGSNDQVQNTQDKLIKFTRLKEVNPSITYIDVSYQVFDPKNEYVAVYLTITSANSEEEEKKIQINKEESSYRILGLSKNQEYTITLSYSTIDPLSSASIETVQDTVKVKTQEPKMNLKVSKISSNKITYVFNQDSNYQLDHAEIQLYIDGILKDTQTVDLNQALTTAGFVSSFTHDGLGQEFEIRLANASYNGEIVDLSLYAKYMNR